MQKQEGKDFKFPKRNLKNMHAFEAHKFNIKEEICSLREPYSVMCNMVATTHMVCMVCLGGGAISRSKKFVSSE